VIDTLMTALGLVLIIEGVAPALFPNKWRAYVLKIAAQPVAEIRNIGILILAIGTIVLWLSQ